MCLNEKTKERHPSFLLVRKDQHDEHKLTCSSKTSNGSCEIEMRNHANNLVFMACVTHKGKLDDVEPLHRPKEQAVCCWDECDVHVNRSFEMIASEKGRTTCHKTLKEIPKEHFICLCKPLLKHYKHAITVHRNWSQSY